MQLENQNKFYLIHCDEHHDRLINIKKEIKNIKNLEIFKGYFTKYNSLKPSDQINYLRTYDNNLKLVDWLFTQPGQIGCYLSHHMIIKKIYDEQTDFNYGYTIILEDDVVFRVDPEVEIEKIIRDIENQKIDFDIVFLGSINNNHYKHIINNIYTLDETKWCWGSHALLINNKNIKKIYENNCLITNEIDNHYKLSIDSNKLNGFIIYPSICDQNINLESNIRENKINQKELEKMVRNKIINSRSI